MNFLEVIPLSKSYFLIFSFILGALFALGFEPFKIPFLPILAIGIFFLVNEYVFKEYQSHFRNFFYSGLFFGFGFFLLSMFWVSNSINELDQSFNYISLIILILLPLCLSIFFGMMQIINAFLWNESNSKLFYFSLTWVFFEFLRSSVFTGLPWNLLGYSWSWSLSFSQSVSIFGVYGLGLITVFCSVSLFSYIINKKNIFYFLISITIFILLLSYGKYRVSENKTVYTEKDIRIVHTHVDQKDKWSKKSIDQTAAIGSSLKLTVFPETSLGFNPNRPENWLFGYIRKDQKKFFNSINYMEYTYDKKILVPFGEYFPFSSIINKIFPKNLFFKNELTKGKAIQLFSSDILPLICYEAIFPSHVRSSVTDKTDLLVNISNDGWFGDFSGPKQHFIHAQFRSIELGIPMARSSNKGISGLISPIGEIINATNSTKTTYLDEKIPKRLNTTIYKEYGNLFTYFLIVLFFIIGYAIETKTKK